MLSAHVGRQQSPRACPRRRGSTHRPRLSRVMAGQEVSDSAPWQKGSLAAGLRAGITCSSVAEPGSPRGAGVAASLTPCCTRDTRLPTGVPFFPLPGLLLVTGSRLLLRLGRMSSVLRAGCQPLCCSQAEGGAIGS